MYSLILKAKLADLFLYQVAAKRLIIVGARLAVPKPWISKQIHKYGKVFLNEINNDYIPPHPNPLPHWGRGD
jgi:hypothetical protein